MFGTPLIASLDQFHIYSSSLVPESQHLKSTLTALNIFLPMALLSSSSSFNNYDVFINFRGSDTRHGFTGHLHKALHDSGIHAFIDDHDLMRGEEITPALKEAIEKSNVAITMLSEDYASSSFCLYELDYILECRRKRKDLLVLPVFYKVSPSHVEHQTGCYGKALAKLNEKFQPKMDDCCIK